MIAALFVVCARDGNSLKLSDPFSEAMFTTTPCVAFRCGHAARGRESTRSTSSLRAAAQSSSVTSSSQLKWVFAARLNRTSTRPNSLTASSTSFVQSAGSLSRHGCSDTILPPAARTISTGPSAGSTTPSQPTTFAPSAANARAVARPMLPPVPVTMQTFPASRPANSAASVRRGGAQLGVGDADLVGVLADLTEVPVDDVEGRVPERARPLAEQLGGDRECRGLHGPGVRQPVDGGAVRSLGATADGVGHVQHVVTGLQRLDRCEGQADLGVQSGNDQPL